MRRKKRFAIGWVALGLAVVAMAPVTAEAKPLPTDTSHEQGMPVYVIGTLSPDRPATLSPDDRAFSRVDSAGRDPVPEPRRGRHPRRPRFRRVGPETTTIVATDDGSRFDVNPYVVTGFGLTLLLLAGGMGIAIRQSRKTTLSTA